MLSAEPRRWYSWDFVLRDSEGGHLGEVALSSWRERGTLSVSGSEYTVRREGLMGPFVLAQEGSVRGQARKTSLCRKELEVELDGDHYTLKARSAWRREFVLLQGEEELGTITPEAWYSRRARVELKEALPPLLKGFVVWLTLLLWKREADAGVAGG